MLADYLPVLVLFVITTAIGLVAMAIPRMLGPRRPSLAKLAPYESGMSPIGPAWKRIPIRFYVTAMLFVIFDVDFFLTIPGMVSLERFGMFGLVELAVFYLLIVIAYVYVWRKGALRWQ